MEKSAGIAVIYMNKMLMTLATNYWSRYWMPPKGHLEEGETEEEAACRETYEECGIKINPELLGRRHLVPYTSRTTGKLYKEVYIFECRIQSLDEIGVPTLIKGELPKYMLQEDEIKEAKFMGYRECKENALPRYLSLVDEIFSAV